MSSNSNTPASSSNFGSLFNAALAKYTKQTGTDLRNHPLSNRIDSCDSPDSILEVFQEQAQAFDQFRRGDTGLFKWLTSVVNVLHALSNNPVLSGSASLVNPATFSIIYSTYLNLLFPRCVRMQRRFSLLSGSSYPCVSLSLSLTRFFSRSGLPGG